MAKLCGRDVLVLERKPTHQYNCTWNISRGELDELAQSGFFSPEELRRLVKGQFLEGVFSIYDPSCPSEPGEFRFDDLFNLCIDEVFFFDCLRRSEMEVRYGAEAAIERVTRKWAYVRARGRVIRTRLFIDARGWMSPLSLLINSGPGRRGFFNVIGARVRSFDSPLRVKERAITCATYSNEEWLSGELVQPILQLLPDGRENGEEVIYLFTRTPRPARLVPLVKGFAQYARLANPKFDEGKVEKLYYGHIPVYHETFSPFQRSAGPRTLYIGEAGNYLGGRPGFGVAAIARNARRVPFEIDLALRKDDLSFERLNRIYIDPREHGSQIIQSLFDMAMVLQKHERRGDVNRDWLNIIRLTDKMEPRLKNWCLSDKVTLRALHSLVWNSLDDASALRAVLKNAEWRVARVAAVFLSGYMKLLYHECSLVARRKKFKYLAAACGAMMRLPSYALGNALMCVKGCRMDYQRKRKARG